MSLEKFYQTIDKSFIGRFIEKRINVLQNTNPDRIYVENVRSFYNMPTWAAQFFCELAVREGIFRKRVGVSCPHDHGIIKSFAKDAEIPDTIVCETCQHLEMEKFEYTRAEIIKSVFYQSLL